ncbi:glucan 1%2C6-alpha-glucosidase [Streptococcus pneumoniae]|nr:glucan 1%2C6-alpha-glucosidase [Streptococcus pneumoniae]
MVIKNKGFLPFIQSSLAYIRKDGDRRFLVVANLSNEEQDLTVEGKVKSVLIENTLAQEVFEKQILVPWDAFCVELL